MRWIAREKYLQFIRTHRFLPYCPICKALKGSINCRMMNHFGARGYDYENERVIYERS